MSVIIPTNGSNNGDLTLANVGSTPADAGASLAVQVLTLQPADATHPGVVTTGTQTIAGAKTFSGTLTSSSGTTALTATGTNLITSATTAASASSTVGAFTLKPTATLDANDLVLDVQSAAAAHLLTVDLEGDVVTAGKIASTGDSTMTGTLTVTTNGSGASVLNTTATGGQIAFQTNNVAAGGSTLLVANTGGVGTTAKIDGNGLIYSSVGGASTTLGIVPCVATTNITAVGTGADRV